MRTGWYVFATTRGNISETSVIIIEVLPTPSK